MEQQIQELATTIQQLRQSQLDLAAENERLREGQAGVQALAQSVGELAQSLKRDTTDRKILMDTKGLGRPEVFDNKEESFRRWIRSINNLVAGVFRSRLTTAVLESCLDSEDPIDLQELANNQHPDVDNIEKVGEQLYRVLCHLCIGESEVKTLLLELSNGYEAYRKLCRRWDPATSGRKRNLLRPILNPERCKSWTAVRPAIEQVEDLVRRYEVSEVSFGGPGSC